MRARTGEPAPDPLFAAPGVLDRAALRELCLAAGADDVGFVEIGRPALADQVAAITAAFPRPRALIALVRRTAVEAIRSPARSVGNLEFHRTGDAVAETGRRIVDALRDHGVRALNPAAGFPMELDAWPGKIWVVAHKPVAVEAGLGRMGIHRNVIHPRFGNFVLLGTVVIDTEVDGYDRPVDFNPCLACKLCVAACPTGAISAAGEFDFSACMTHNYRDFLGGFGDWVETVAEAGSAPGYRAAVPDTETVPVWQSLSFGPQYKAAYCVSVCPAGEDVIGPWLDDRRGHLAEVVRRCRTGRSRSTSSPAPTPRRTWSAASRTRPCAGWARASVPPPWPGSCGGCRWCSSAAPRPVWTPPTTSGSPAPRSATSPW